MMPVMPGRKCCIDRNRTTNFLAHYFVAQALCLAVGVAPPTIFGSQVRPVGYQRSESMLLEKRPSDIADGRRADDDRASAKLRAAARRALRLARRATTKLRERTGGRARVRAKNAVCVDTTNERDEAATCGCETDIDEVGPEVVPPPEGTRTLEKNSSAAPLPSAEDALARAVGRDADKYLEECFSAEPAALDREKFESIPETTKADLKITVSNSARSMLRRNCTIRLCVSSFTAVWKSLRGSSEREAIAMC